MIIYILNHINQN